MKCVLAAALLLSSAESVAAGTATANLQISATVAAGCIVSTTGLTFETVDPTSTLSTDKDGKINVTCTKDTDFVVSLGAGISGVISDRSMTSASTADTLKYSLYKNSTRTQNWGSAGVDAVKNTGTGAVQELTVYGSVAPGQYVKAGSYTDTVIVTVAY